MFRLQFRVKNVGYWQYSELNKREQFTRHQQYGLHTIK